MLSSILCFLFSICYYIMLCREWSIYFILCIKKTMLFGCCVCGFMCINYLQNEQNNIVVVNVTDLHALLGVRSNSRR